MKKVVYCIVFTIILIGCGSDKNDSEKKYLNWSERSMDMMVFSEAEKYCEDLVEKDFSDWRVPSISELRTAIKNCSKTQTDGTCKVTDECLKNNCYSEELCKCDYDGSGKYSIFGEKVLTLWSSSLLGDDPQSGWVVFFEEAQIHSRKKILSTYVRCVRNSETPMDDSPEKINSSVTFMNNFKAEDGGYGQMYNEGSLIGVSFYFWNGENNENTCKKEFLSPPPHNSYMRVEGLMEIKVTINGFEKGEYKIVKDAESDFFFKDEKLATIKACVWHEEELQPGFEDCYVPYTGTVTIDKDVPQTVKESKNVEITLKIDADFPEESIRLIYCEGLGEENEDGETIEWEVCTCRQDDGTNSQCTPGYKGENCCYNPESKMVNYKLDYKTTVCNLYCSVTTESPSDMEKCEL